MLIRIENDLKISREWMIDHLEIESTVLHKDSEEAQIQLQKEGANKLGQYLVILLFNS